MTVKQIVRDTRKHYQKVFDDASSHQEQFEKIDKNLTSKIKKIKEVSKEIVDYIDKRSDK